MRTGVFQAVVLACLLAGCCAQKADVARLRVAPDTMLDSPQRALDEVLRLRASGLVEKDRQIVVEFACGIYAVGRPLEITAAHGPLLLKGAGTLGTVFSGGKELGVFNVETNGRVWRTSVAADWAFDQLFINRKRADLSSPDKCLDPWLPGAWYRDGTTHEVVYVARPGEHPLTTTAVVGAVDSLMILRDAADVTVEGISFMYNVCGREGADGAVVVCEGGLHLVFSDCAFRLCDNYGLQVIGGAADVSIRHCRFDDVASGALRVCDAVRMVFEDNVVSSCGRASVQATVRIERGRHCKVVHNDFCNLKCAGVSCPEGCETGFNRFWKVPGEADSPREGEAGVSGKDPVWRARVELLTF